MIKNIAVIGAGTMGHSIAACFAMKEYKVSIYESFEAPRLACLDKIKSQLEFLSKEDLISADQISKSLSCITMFDNLEQAVADADYVIEAIPENVELKQELFSSLSRYCKRGCVFASNTSSIPFSDLTAKMDEADKKRTMVCHWYNPGHLIPLVELSYFGNMTEEMFAEVYDLYRSIDKRPAKVLKDIPGLLANRIQQAVAREVFSLMQMGAGEAEDIDAALKYGPAFRYSTTGQLEVADFGGLDIWCIVGDNLLPEIDSSKKACDLLREKVAAGKLGFKSGEGFFSYPEDKKQEILDAYYKKLITQLKISKEY